MNKDQVLLALGQTGCVSVGLYRGNMVETWLYSVFPVQGSNMLIGKVGICQRDSSAFAKDTVIYFEDGILVGWENLPPGRIWTDN